jgi:hypothetical protein
MPVWNGVTWREMSGKVPGASPEGSLDPTGESQIQMSLRLDWDDLIDQMAGLAFLGSAATLSTWNALATPKFISRINPFSHPDWPASFYLASRFTRFVGEVPDSPAIGPNGTATYQKALVTLAFRSLPGGYRVLPDADVVRAVGNTEKDGSTPANPSPQEYFCLRNMEVYDKATSKAQSIPPASGLRWVGSGAPPRLVASAAFVNLSEGEVTLKWWPVPIAAYDEAGFLALVGKTNGKEFPPALAGGPTQLFTPRSIGTLVQQVPEKELIRFGDCQPALRITLKYKFYPYGANKFFWWDRPTGLGGPGYHAVATADGQPLFPSANYETAFMPP